MTAQLDLFNALPPVKAVRGLPRYDVAYLTDGSHGGARRQHALLDRRQAICGAAPGIKPLTWQPAYGAVTCPKCLSLIRYNERASQSTIRG